MLPIWSHLRRLGSPNLRRAESNESPKTLQSASRFDDSSNTTPSSTFRTTVCLKDWWLVKADKELNGKRLAVAGFAPNDQQYMDLFTSAPVIKRHDMFTLETADGITVSVQGSINQSRSLEHGISSEACKDFLFGFPFYWEDVACQFSEENCDTSISGATNSGLSKSRDSLNGDSKGNSWEEKTENFNSDDLKGVGLRMNAEVLPSDSDVNLQMDGENLHGNGFGGIDTFPNTPIRVHSTEKVRINLSNTLNDSSVHNVSAVKGVHPSNKDVGTPSESSKRLLRTFKVVENLSNRINSIMSPRITDPNPHLSASKEHLKDDVIHSDAKCCDTNSSIFLKKLLTSPNDCQNLGNLSVKVDTFKNPSVAIGSDAKVANLSRVDTILAIETNNFFLKNSPERLESFNRKIKNKADTKGDATAPLDSAAVIVTPSEIRTAADTSKDYLVTPYNERPMCRIKSKTGQSSLISVSQDNQAVLGNNVEGELSHHTSKCLPGVGYEGIKSNNVPVAFHIGNNDSWGVKNLNVNVIVRNTKKGPDSTVEVFDYDRKHTTGSCPSKASTMKGKLNCRRSSRLKKSNDITNNRVETENPISLCPDSVTTATDNLDRISGDRNAFERPVSMAHDIIENDIDNMNSESGNGNAMDDFSVGVVETSRGFGKSWERESYKSDVNCTDNLKSLVGEESVAEEPGASRKTRKRKVRHNTDASSPPLTRNKKKVLSSVSPYYFSCKSSKSGRLLVPPLEFWRNEQVVYGVDGAIAGVLKSFLIGTNLSKMIFLQEMKRSSNSKLKDSVRVVIPGSNRTSKTQSR